MDKWQLYAKLYLKGKIVFNSCTPFCTLGNNFANNTWNYIRVYCRINETGRNLLNSPGPNQCLKQLDHRSGCLLPYS